MSGHPLRVIKLGGSLLDWPDLVERLRAWLAAQPTAANVMVVGGGAIVDHLRQLDKLQAMSDQSAHWLAIRAMGLTAAMVAELMTEASLVHELSELRRDTPELQILNVESFLTAEKGSDALPASWEVTSDSIAARLAARLEAGELALLKSAAPAANGSLESLARDGYVDAYFPQAARGLAVRFVNLRES